ncbi:MAG TPA: VOC family protein [Candidatus Eisenbacteria bacterium]|jgi:catechol 2,3-dioxygenase
MARETIHPSTTVGSVHLTVRDLDALVSYYSERLGFAPSRRTREGVALGAGGPDLLVLAGRPDAPRARGTTGLYHFAVLVPSRRDLADALQHLLDTRTPLAGASDHGVSEALYLADPEGNGIEIYRDRPRAEWPMENGQPLLVSDPLDLDGLLADRSARGGTGGLPAGTRIGHVHLRVADLAAAERFYADALGFEIVARLGGAALFVAAGGYHHHIGLNTWGGEGAPPPPPGAAGLRHFVLRLPDAKERDKVVERARAAGIGVEESQEGAALADPSSNRLVLAV